MLTFSLTLLSCNSYVLDFRFTFGSECGEGCDSKLVLNSVSMSVDLPRPVSPMHMMLKTNPCCTLLFTSWSGNESNPT